MGLLLDSSVIAKWFLDEPGTARALQLQDQHLSGRVSLFYAELSLFEVANALHFSRKFTASEIVEAIAALEALNMRRLGYNQDALNRAVSLAQQYGTAIYDSYLVALAEKHHIVFLTADRKLLHRMKLIEFVQDLDLHPR